MADKLEEFLGNVPEHFGFKVTPTYRTNPTDTISPGNNKLTEGYVAVITGAGVGIGEYIARSYVEAGAAGVVITGRRANVIEETKGKLEKLASELGTNAKITAVAGDAEKNEHYIELKDHVEKEYGGRVDALICNAGPGRASPASWTGKIHDQPIEDWDSTLNVNLHGPYYGARHFIPLLLKSPSHGTIINIVSAAAHMTNGNPPISYSVSKFAEARLTQNIGETYVDEGLQAFALHPGAVKTPGAIALLPEAMLAVLTDSIELAGNISVWLSAKRPQWLSGRYLAVNWDIDELSKRKDEIEKNELFKFKMAV